MPSERFSLKDHLFNPRTVGSIATEIEAVHPDFDRLRFVADVLGRFPDLELMDRARHIRDTLIEFLPDDYRSAAGILLDSLPPPLDPERTDDDFGDYIYLPYGLFVVERGLSSDDVDFSLAALKELTQRFSMEFPIRHFLDAFPEQTMAALREWVHDDNYHVRRLVSEGTRPKLPWAQRISLDYTEPIALLDSLHADSTRYVTRSVANHLNDISKLDPALAIATVERWQREQAQEPKELAYISRHALRTLVRNGNAEALVLLGYEKPNIMVEALTCATPEVRIGEALEFSFTLCSQARKPQKLLVDYVLWSQKASGELVPKTFRVTKCELAAGQRRDFQKSHPLRPMTTRKLYPGPHRVELQVNGRKFGSFEFRLIE